MKYIYNLSIDNLQFFVLYKILRENEFLYFFAPIHKKIPRALGCVSPTE